MVRDKQTGFERLVLLDFGAARNYTQGKYTQNYTRILTPGYAPYEQYLELTRFGPFTDIYALCATLYTAITGKRPPTAPDRKAHDTLAPFSSFGLNVPPGVEKTILHGMAIEPKDRPRDMRMLYDELYAAISPNDPKDRKYFSARELMASERYEEAWDLLTQIPGWRDADSLLIECSDKMTESRTDKNYWEALDLMDSGQYEEASRILSKISGWRDSDSLLNECTEKISRGRNDKTYWTARERMTEGKYKEGLELFRQIPGWEDSDQYIKECERKIAAGKRQNLLITILLILTVGAGGWYVLLRNPKTGGTDVEKTIQMTLTEIQKAAELNTLTALTEIPLRETETAAAMFTREAEAEQTAAAETEQAVLNETKRAREMETEVYIRVFQTKEAEPT